MIKITEKATYLSGDLGTLLGEITVALNKLYFQMKENIGEERANMLLAEVGRKAIMTEEELKRCQMVNQNDGRGVTC